VIESILWTVCVHALICSYALEPETEQNSGSVRMCLALTCHVTSVWRFLQLVFYRAVYPGKYLLMQDDTTLMYRVGFQKQDSVGICFA
jgi:hypothetical protein